MTHTIRNPPVYWLFGLPFDGIDLESAARLLRESARHRQRLIFATPNLNFLRSSREQPAFRRDVLNTDLSLVDGMPLVWLGRIIGIPFPERVAGSSLLESLINSSYQDDGRLRIYFFGAEGDAAEKAVARVNTPASALHGVGALNPGHGSVETLSTPSIIEGINSSGAEFLVVSLGAVKGHAWIEHNRENLTPSVISHLGAVVNFLAGTVRRAPLFLQKLGLEWVWRAIQEPHLLARYTRDGVFLASVVLGATLPLWLRNKRIGNSKLIVPAGERSDDRVTVHPRGVVTAANLPALQSTVDHAINSGVGLVQIDMRDVDHLDARALGYLYALRFRRQGGPLVRVAGRNPRLQRVLRWQRAECLWDDGPGSYESAAQRQKSGASANAG